MADAPRDLPPAEPRGEPCTFEFEGTPVRGHVGEPLAVALLAADVRVLGRSPKYHRPRGAFCYEGHCASCFVRVDGRPNVRACQIPVREGLRCERQNAFPDADLDVLAAADWLFPQGMDHHHLMTGSRIANDLFLKLVRQMGGSGTLPDAPPAQVPAGRHVHVDVCVVGAGPAGLAAATALAQEGIDVVVVDEQDIAGGSLLAEPGGVARARELSGQARQAGVLLWSRSVALAYYPDELGSATDGPPGVLAVVTPDGLVRLRARRYVYATGGYDQPLAFAGNDRPTVLSARACGRLVFRWGVRPASRVVVVEDEAAPFAYADRLIAGLDAAGVRTRRAKGAPPSRLGRDDVLAAAALPAPAFELPRQHGAEVRLDPARGGFCVAVTDRFATAAPHVYAVGDITGYVGPEAAAQAGGLAAAVVASDLRGAKG